jgi:flagellar protein FliS
MSDTVEMNPYLKTKILTASPEELRLMLIEGAIRFSRSGRDALATKDYEGVFENLTKAKEIILELMNALRPEMEPELCGNLERLYNFMYRRLMDANVERDPSIVDEVIDLLEYDRETWVLLMEKVATERASGATAPAIDDSADESGEYAAAAPVAGGGFSVEG